MSQTKPRLFIKPGCPWCIEAMAYLDNKKLPYEPIDVISNTSAYEEMRTLSGQSKTPTMDWEGDILADFGVDELVPFLKNKGAI